jgi:hypothetical protein
MYGGEQHVESSTWRAARGEQHAGSNTRVAIVKSKSYLLGMKEREERERARETERETERERERESERERVQCLELLL